MNAGEFAELLRKRGRRVSIEPECPLTAPENVLVTWTTPRRAGPLRNLRLRVSYYAPRWRRVALAALVRALPLSLLPTGTSAADLWKGCRRRAGG